MSENAHFYPVLIIGCETQETMGYFDTCLVIANNAIAKIDITAKTATNIFTLGFKDYNQDVNPLDPSTMVSSSVLFIFST
ncbi:hypothetical protein [Olivibacter domesticus]|uniref:Uncharacterized protein n=1 Tax=Olivibacter domesticus TaxID=407022 RepID=A0A1H7GPF6_OLID1|nr:hypothetical protein [Olivibacter domesticus]SEK38872.1 hypothetical protein SAMN05661044_00122 [Olivibacter domesticus]